MEKFYTLDELESALKIKKRTLKLYIHQGRLNGVYGPNRRILIPESEIERFLENLPKTPMKRGGK